MKLFILSILVAAATASALPTGADKSDKLVKDASSSAAISSRSGDQTVERFYIDPAMPPPYPPMKLDELPKRDVNKDVNCHNHVDCEGGYCLGGICLAEPPLAKRDVAKDVKCYGNIDCEGGSCLNNICIANPPTKKRDDAPGWGDIGGTCSVDKDCGPGNSCLSGVCVDKPPAQPPAFPLCGNGFDCKDGKECLNGHCVAV